MSDNRLNAQRTIYNQLLNKGPKTNVELAEISRGEFEIAQVQRATTNLRRRGAIVEDGHEGGRTRWRAKEHFDFKANPDPASVKQGAKRKKNTALVQRRASHNTPLSQVEIALERVEDTLATLADAVKELRPYVMSKDDYEVLEKLRAIAPLFSANK